MSSKDEAQASAAADAPAKPAAQEDPEDGLTEEDRELKNKLEELVTALTETGASDLGGPLEEMRTTIRESTSSMTSVPKPLKFLAPHYDALKSAYAALPASAAVRPRFADVLSVLAMVHDAAPMAEALAKISKEDNQGKERKKAEADKAEEAGEGTGKKAAGEEEAKEDEGAKDADDGAGEAADGPQDGDAQRSLLAEAQARATRECLQFKLEGDASADIGQWGHEYVRTLAGQVGREYEVLLEAEAEDEDEDEEVSAARDARIDALVGLVNLIAPYCMAHNAEAEAVDLLMETQRLPALVEGEGIRMDEQTRTRVCLYLLRCSDYLGDADDIKEALHVALALHLQNEQYTDAARVALRMGQPGQVRRVLEACGPGEEGTARRLQIGYLLGRHGYRRVGYGLAEDEEADEEDDIFDSAAATAVGSAVMGRGGMPGADESASSSSAAASSAAAGASGSSAAPLMASASTSSVAAHRAALGRRGAVNGSWLPPDEELPTVARLSDEVKDAIGNASLSEHFRLLAKELDLVKPRSPDEVFKTQTADAIGFRPGMGPGGERLDSARQNLASSYVSAFVNAGHGRDALLYEGDDDDDAGADVFKWVHRNDSDGRLAAAAALGLVHLWDHEEGPIAPQPLVESADPQVVAGGALAIGLSCVGTATETDVAKELLEVYVDPEAPRRSQPTPVRSSALLGLALAYAGSGRADVGSMLSPYVADTRDTWGKDAAAELAAVAGLGLGFVYVGTGDADIATLLADRVAEAAEGASSHPLFRHLALGLGLVFQGLGAEADPTLRDLEGIEGPTGKEVRLLVTACAYAGTGNVEKAQEMLRVCGEHPEGEDREKRRKELEEEAEAGGGAAAEGEDGEADASAASAAGAARARASASASASAASGDEPSTSSSSPSGGNPKEYQFQTIAALGLGAIAMGEELGASMVERAAEHLMQYGDPAVRRAVPLTIALTRLSDPAYATIDTLSKLSHDSDAITSQSAILAMGLVGCGTNNSRLAGMLRQLATFHRRDKDHVFLVRIAQGLVAAGKGLVTLSPVHSDRVLVRPAALAAVLSVALTSLDLPGTLLGKHHSLLMTLAPALMPRMVMTVDAETREAVTVDVRIGAAVETVGQAGRPKTITGFQTHTTPALMSARDRAEVATPGWEPMCSVLEGVVLLQRREIEDGSAEAEAKQDRARRAAASALARVPSRMAGIMAAASGAADDD